MPGGGEIPPVPEGLRMAQAAWEGEVWKWAQAVFSRLFFASSAPCPMAPLMKLSGSHLSILRLPGYKLPPAATCGMFPPSQIFLLLFGPFSSWRRRRGVPMPHLLPSPRVTPCPKSGRMLCHPAGEGRVVTSLQLLPSPHFDFWL